MLACSIACMEGLDAVGGHDLMRVRFGQPHGLADGGLLQDNVILG